MPEIIDSLVSTIVPVYNRPQMIREAVASVLAQTYRPIEVIIVDDGSSDDTPRVAEELARQTPEEIRFLRKHNSGPGLAREAGRQLARGEFIQYLDSDDLLRPRKFEWQVAALRERPDCGAAYGYIRVHPRNKPPLEKPFRSSGESRDTLFPWLLADRWWHHDCALFRRSVCDAIGPWSDLRWLEDWEYDGRIAALGTRLVHVKDFVSDERHQAVNRQSSTGEHLSHLQCQIRFFNLMLGYADRSGIAPDDIHRRHFTRWIFATARDCAYSGFHCGAQQCMELAERAAGDCRVVRSGFATFRSCCRWLGTRNAARLFVIGQRLKRPGHHTLQESFARDLG